jgi:hypothetical protein
MKRLTASFAWTPALTAIPCYFESKTNPTSRKGFSRNKFLKDKYNSLHVKCTNLLARSLLFAGRDVFDTVEEWVENNTPNLRRTPIFSSRKNVTKLPLKFKIIRYYYLCQLTFSGYPDWGFSVLFLQLWGKCQGILRKDGARPALFLNSELRCSMYCLCRLCCPMYCLCVNVYCTTATGCQPNCS